MYHRLSYDDCKPISEQIFSLEVPVMTPVVAKAALKY